VRTSRFRGPVSRASTPASARRASCHAPASQPEGGRRGNPHLRNLRAFGRGLRGSWKHWFGHWNGRSGLRMFLGTAALGVTLNAAGIEVEKLARPLVIGTTIYTAGRVSRDLSRSRDPEDFSERLGHAVPVVGEALAHWVGLELVPHELPSAASLASVPGLVYGNLLSPAAEGVLGLHHAWLIDYPALWAGLKIGVETRNWKLAVAALVHLHEHGDHGHEPGQQGSACPLDCSVTDAARDRPERPER
jgi:hypothetical protein